MTACKRCKGSGWIRLKTGQGPLGDSLPCPTCHGAPEWVEKLVKEAEAKAKAGEGAELEGAELEELRAEFEAAKAEFGAEFAAVRAAVRAKDLREARAESGTGCPACGGGGIVWEDGGYLCPCWSWRAK